MKKGLPGVQKKKPLVCYQVLLLWDEISERKELDNGEVVRASTLHASMFGLTELIK